MTVFNHEAMPAAGTGNDETDFTSNNSHDGKRDEACLAGLGDEIGWSGALVDWNVVQYLYLSIL